eukprot:scaffold158894_cov16-Prasinocladus_malaysianus.AAC.2
MSHCAMHASSMLVNAKPYDVMARVGRGEDRCKAEIIESISSEIVSVESLNSLVTHVAPR